MDQLFTPEGLAFLMIAVIVIAMIFFIVLLVGQANLKETLLERFAQSEIEQQAKQDSTKHSLNQLNVKVGGYYTDMHVDAVKNHVILQKSLEQMDTNSAGRYCELRDQLKRIEAETKNKPVRDDQGRYQKRSEKAAALKKLKKAKALAAAVPKSTPAKAEA